MARRKSRTSATGGNMDSMLDTLTNVVGILVIVLVAVQLSSQEAASRIADELEKIDPAEVARLQEQAEDARTRAEAAAEALRVQRQAVLNPREELARLEVALEIENDLAAQAAARASALEKEREAADATMRKAVEERARREEARKQAEERLAKAREVLEKLPRLQAPPAKEVRLPDPRPAPAKVKHLHVLCREGRIWVVDIEALQEKAQKRADFVVKSKKLDPDGDGWISDGEAFVSEFNKAPVRSGDFTMTLVVVGNRTPYLVLERTKGESPDDTIKGSGDLARILLRLEPDSHIVRFFVWPDSFEAYLQVREFTGERGYAAGWEPMGSPDEHRIPLGKYQIGEKPPPPAPPAPGTKPPPPPPPPNLVD